MRWVAAILLAVAHDLVDLIGLGLLPFAGDLLDAVSTLVLFPLIGGAEPVITVLELVPGSDILPVFTFVTLWAYYRADREPGGPGWSKP